MLCCPHPRAAVPVGDPEPSALPRQGVRPSGAGHQHAGAAARHGGGAAVPAHLRPLCGHSQVGGMRHATCSAWAASIWHVSVLRITRQPILLCLLLCGAGTSSTVARTSPRTHVSPCHTKHHSNKPAQHSTVPCTAQCPALHCTALSSTFACLPPPLQGGPEHVGRVHPRQQAGCHRGALHGGPRRSPGVSPGARLALPAVSGAGHVAHTSISAPPPDTVMPMAVSMWIRPESPCVLTRQTVHVLCQALAMHPGLQYRSLLRKPVPDVLGSCTHPASICAARMPMPLGPPADHTLLCQPQPRRYGIEGTLDEMFEAPAVIKSVLGDLANINTCYVGNASTSECIERVGALHAGPCCMNPACCVLRPASCRNRHDSPTLSTACLQYAPAARAVNMRHLSHHAQTASQAELSPPCLLPPPCR